MDVTRHEAARRFELTVDGHTAILAYRERDGQVTLVHTEVRPSSAAAGSPIDWPAPRSTTPGSGAGASGPSARSSRRSSGATRSTPTSWPRPPPRADPAAPARPRTP